MGIIADLILIAIVVIFIMIGYKKGLTGSLIKLASFAIAVILAVILYKPLTNVVMENTQIDEKIEETIIQNFSKEENENKNEENMPTTLVNSINNKIDQETTAARNEIVEKTAKTTTLTIMRIGTAIVIYILARIILFIVALLAKGITQLPLLKQIDKTGGIVYGLLQGAVIVYVVLGLVSLISVIWTNNPVVEAVNKSYLCSILYNNNIILKLIFK